MYPIYMTAAGRQESECRFQADHIMRHCQLQQQYIYPKFQASELQLITIRGLG